MCTRNHQQGELGTCRPGESRRLMLCRHYWCLRMLTHQLLHERHIESIRKAARNHRTVWANVVAGADPCFLQGETVRLGKGGAANEHDNEKKFGVYGLVQTGMKASVRTCQSRSQNISSIVANLDHIHKSMKLSFPIRNSIVEDPEQERIAVVFQWPDGPHRPRW